MSYKAYRRFLATPSSGVDSYVKIAENHHSIEFKLADCDRRVTLWFYWDTAKSRQHAKRKLQGLKDAVTYLEEALNEKI